MPDPEHAIERLEFFEDPGFLYPLSQYSYTGRSEWMAEATITIVHGDNKQELLKSKAVLYPRYKLTIQVRPYASVRWLTLEEAEMIAERLQSEET